MSVAQSPWSLALASQWCDRASEFHVPLTGDPAQISGSTGPAEAVAVVSAATTTVATTAASADVADLHMILTQTPQFDTDEPGPPRARLIQ